MYCLPIPLYDMAGKPLAVYTGEAVATPEDVPGERLVVRYEYNGAGQVVREENRDSLLTYAYDEFGRLSRVDYPNLGRWVTYDYGLDRPTWVSVYDRSYSTSLSVYDYVLAYNASGEVASARNRGGAYYGHYAYDENGRRLQRTLGNGTVNSYEYDDNDRLKQLSITHDGEVLASFRYSHDGAGNRTGIEYGDGSRSVYEYDEAYRLIRDLRVDARGGTLYDESYAYDAVGNRLRKTRHGGRKPVDVAYAYNARNQLVSATGDEAGEYEYDRDGNLIRTAGPHGVESREYDVLGRLTGYAGPGGTERYTHIGADWKRQTAVYSPVDGEEEKYTFLYDGDNVLMDLVGDSLTLRNTYVTPYLDETLVMICAGEGADHYYMSQDGLGSVRVLNSGQGHLRNVYDYTAYGEPDPVSTFNGPTVTHQRYGYTGRDNNSVARDMFNRHRSYLSSYGRFSTRDPLLYDGSIYGNIYDYGTSNPQNKKDPFGLSPLSRNVAPKIKPTPDKGDMPAIDCLLAICRELPKSKNPECPEEGSMEQCNTEALEIANAYGTLQHRFFKDVNTHGWAGNGVGRVGCANLAQQIYNDTKKYARKDGFNMQRIFSPFVFDHWPAPHYFVVFGHAKSPVRCASTMWDTNWPSMKDLKDYKHYSRGMTWVVESTN